MIYFKQNKFMKTEEKEREGKRIPDQNLRRPFQVLCKR